MSVLQLSEDPVELVEQLSAYFNRYDREVKAAEALFEIEGERLEILARNLPKHQAHYSLLAQEAKHIMKWLENNRCRIEARLTRNYLQGQRVYGARETTTLVAGERDMIEQNQLITEISLWWQRLDAIVEAFKQMGWSLGNITKLHVASLQDVIV